MYVWDDTVMPGYFISDVGDMVRTYVSPASEEETDLGKVVLRRDFYQAIVEGYLGSMGDVYYGAKYKGHNYHRAANQTELLRRLMEFGG